MNPHASSPRRFLALLLVITPFTARAHCDTMDGPVVAAARSAIAKGDVTPVLMWVKPADEPVIRDAFQQALGVRRGSAAAATLADRWFFETLVRVHRAGEGAPYTGLKAEATRDEGIESADAALADGKVDTVLAHSIAPLETTLRKKFDRVRELKGHASHSVDAGREYVAAYVDYVHLAEKVAALSSDEGTAHAKHAH